MSKNLAGLLQVLGAGAAGYMQGKRLQDKDAEAKADRDQERAFLNEQRARERAQWAEQDDLKQTLKDSQADIVVEEMPGADPNYNPASMTGERDPGTPAPAPAGFKVGTQTFAGRADADSAVLGLNSRAAKDARAAAALREKGQLEAARKHEEFAKSAINEGTDQILAAISATAPRVEDVKKSGGMVAGTIGAQAAEIFNKTGGKWRVTADTMVQHFVDKDAAGREFVNSRVLGKDGKPVVEDVRGATMMLADFKTRLAQQNQDTQTYQSGLKINEDVRHNKVGEVQTAENNRAQRAIQSGTLALQQQRLALEKSQFKKQTPQGQIETIEEITGAKLTVDEKKKFLGIGKGKEGPNKEQELVDDLSKKYVENNPTATAGDVANYRQSLVESFGAVRGNAQVAEALRADFGGKEPNSPAYAATYQNAKDKLRMSDADLAALGYKPPAAAKRSAAATMGTAGNAAPTGPRKSSAYAPFTGTPRTTQARKDQEAREAVEEQAAERTAQAAKIQRNITQLERTLASGSGNDMFRQSAAAKLARHKAELDALNGIASQ